MNSENANCKSTPQNQAAGGQQERRRPTSFESVLPLITVAVFLGFGYGYLRLRAEVLLISSAVVAGLLGMRLGYTYSELLDGITTTIKKGLPAILIVISVGALIGSWIAAGTVPMLIYFGLKVISPRFFLLTACVVSSVVSVVTGTSYGTVGTIGVAFMGIAHGLGIPLPQAGGAIIAGAYFGDKISPFSDTTNLAPIAAGSNLYDHIQHMLWTTTPAWLLGLLIYFLLGFFGQSTGGASLGTTEQIMSVLKKSFIFSWILLLPPAITLFCAVRKKPIIPGMLLSSLVATILAVVLQKMELRPAVEVLVSGFEPATGHEMVDQLLRRGGMATMMRVILITFSAFSFGGIVQKTQMLDVLLENLLKVANTASKVIACSIASGLATAMLTGSSFLSILIPGELFAPAYKKFNLAAKNLSRTTEDSGTVIVPLIPWSIAGVFMSGTLGIDTLDYAKWAFMNYTGFIFALIYAFTGFAIAPRKREDETIPGS